MKTNKMYYHALLFVCFYYVIRDKKETTKILLVFDASLPSRKDGPSLNDILHGGWSLTSLLFDVTCKFQSYNYAIVSDLEKVFLQVDRKNIEIIQDLFVLKM